MKFAVSAESLQHTIVIFVVDMSRPWTVMESLEKWAGVLREHIDKLKIPPEEMRGMQQKSKSLCTPLLLLFVFFSTCLLPLSLVMSDFFWLAF